MSPMTSLRHAFVRPASEQATEPTLRDILRSRGIEPEGDARNRRRRERRRALTDLQADYGQQPRKQVALSPPHKS